jgi:hypothetical protein
MCKVLRAAYQMIAGLAVLIGALGFSACTGDRPEQTTPPAGILPHEIRDIRLGMTVAQLLISAPATEFAPYDGLHLAIENDRSGFRMLKFYTGELYPERTPASDARLEEIRLEGDSVDASVVTRISEALVGANPLHRCAHRIASDVVIWEPEAPTTGVELILSQQRPRRARLRLFAGRWQETPVTAGSTAGRCSPVQPTGSGKSQE